mgnify:CR=1 FL=1
MPFIQAQHFFKFKVPAEKTYDDKVSFKCDKGYFTKNENGNYVVPTEKIPNRKTVYAIKNNLVIDSFDVKNLYMQYRLTSDNFNVSQKSMATWDEVKILKNLRFELRDEGKVLKEIKISKIVVVVSKKDGVRTKSFSYKEFKNELNIEDLIRGGIMESGDLLIFTGITIVDTLDVKKKVPGYTIHIGSEEDMLEEKATKEFTKTEKTVKIYNTTLKEGYYLKGKVLENNHATFNELDLGSSQNASEIAKVIKSANITAMIGAWEIYLPTGQLYAKGNISYSPDLGTYKLDDDWELVTKIEKAQE